MKALGKLLHNVGILYYCELRPWRALYECYCIVILLYMNEAICKVLYEAICKVLCEAICEGMMWMSFMWSYMWRYDVNEFYVILWWSYVKWIALWVKVWFLMMYIWNDVGLWSILKWKCVSWIGRLRCLFLIHESYGMWSLDLVGLGILLLRNECILTWSLIVLKW